MRAITSVERTLIPFGLRLFHTSCYGRYYYIPGIGRAFMTITNFNDGILMETKQEKYIITPKNPEDFRKPLENKI